MRDREAMDRSMREPRTALAPILLLGLLLIPGASQGQPAGQLSKANTAWVAYAQEAIIPIASRDADDFADLMFLKEEIGDKRLVWLGENAHDIHDNNVLKYRLIRFLHQEMGYTVVAFEGGVANCGLTNLARDSLDGMRMLVHSVMGYWRVKNNCALFEYLKGSGMEVAGFDPNNNALYLPREQYRQLFPGNKALADKYHAADSLHTHYALDRGRYYHAKKRDGHTELELDNRRAALLERYEVLLQEVSDHYGDRSSSRVPYLTHQVGIASRLQVLTRSNAARQDVSRFHVTNEERDSLMARNLEFIADVLYPDQKIIVWAHNAHISKRGYHRRDAVSMGSYLSAEHKGRSFVMGLYHAGAQWGPGTQRNSLEAILTGTTHGTGYLPLDAHAPVTPGNMWLHTSIPNAFAPKPMPLVDLYDGILFMNDVEKSTLIPFNKEFRCE